MLKFPLFTDYDVVEANCNFKQIDEAREKIKTILRSLPVDQSLLVSFSAGKDSCLLLQLALEVAIDTGTPLERIKPVISITRAESIECMEWHKKHVFHAFKKSGVKLYKVAPSLFYNYFVQTIGRGVDGLHRHPKQYRCVGRWKIDVMQTFKRDHKGVFIVGRRKDESKRRAAILKSDDSLNKDPRNNASVGRLYL